MKIVMILSIVLANIDAFAATMAQTNLAEPTPLNQPMQVDRYTRYKSYATLEEINPLLVLTQINFPSQTKTVYDAIEHALQRSGYRVDWQYSADAYDVFSALEMPMVHRKLNLMTLKDAITTLAGEAWQLFVDSVNRKLIIRLRDQLTWQIADNTSSADTAQSTTQERREPLSHASLSTNTVPPASELKLASFIEHVAARHNADATPTQNSSPPYRSQYDEASAALAQQEYYYDADGTPTQNSSPPHRSQYDEASAALAQQEYYYNADGTPTQNSSPPYRSQYDEASTALAQQEYYYNADATPTQNSSPPYRSQYDEASAALAQQEYYYNADATPTQNSSPLHRSQYDEASAALAQQEYYYNADATPTQNSSPPYRSQYDEASAVLAQHEYYYNADGTPTQNSSPPYRSQYDEASAALAQQEYYYDADATPTQNSSPPYRSQYDEASAALAQQEYYYNADGTPTQNSSPPYRSQYDEASTAPTQQAYYYDADGTPTQNSSPPYRSQYDEASAAPTQQAYYYDADATPTPRHHFQGQKLSVPVKQSITNDKPNYRRVVTDSVSHDGAFNKTAYFTKAAMPYRDNTVSDDETPLIHPVQYIPQHISSSAADHISPDAAEQSAIDTQPEIEKFSQRAWSVQPIIKAKKGVGSLDEAVMAHYSSISVKELIERLVPNGWSVHYKVPDSILKQKLTSHVESSRRGALLALFKELNLRALFYPGEAIVLVTEKEPKSPNYSKEARLETMNHANSHAPSESVSSHSEPPDAILPVDTILENAKMIKHLMDAMTPPLK